MKKDGGTKGKGETSSVQVSTSELQWRKERYASQRERKPHFDSISFRPQPALVTPESLGAIDYQTDLGYPGEFPFTRGVQPTMYRGRLWTMRQFSGFGTPEDTNARFKYLLGHGQTGLSTAFDMPTLMGFDPDHPHSFGEVGREGVSVATIDDVRRLFDGIPLDQITVSMTINCTATVVLAMYFAVAKERGIPLDKLGGTIQNDMLKEFIAQKEWICPPAPSVKLACDIIEFCSKEVPKFNGISISGYHIREAGATASQELAFTLADGLGYIDHCLSRGMVIDDFAPRLSFFFDIHNDFFEEIAKLRAARRLWARLVRERYGAKNERSLMLRTHAQTAGVSLTAQQPTNNVARVALQALAAVLGGVQSLHTNSLDETLSLPTEEAAKVALRTQQIIAEESGVANVIDPLGGSYYLERLTNELEAEARTYIEKIDAMGGILHAVEVGYPQREISEAAYKFQQRVDDGRYSTVGVNCYADDVAQEVPTFAIDPAIERTQKERIARFRAARDERVCEAAAARVREACEQNINVMPSLIHGVSVGLTLGEVSEIYRAVYGKYTDPGFV